MLTFEDIAEGDNDCEEFSHIPDYPIIAICDSVREGDWMLEVLYRKENGKVRMWCVYYTEHDKTLHMKHGFVGFNYRQQINDHKIEINTSGRSYGEQAFLEAKARFLVKRNKDGYSTSLETKSITGCMLAYPYKETSIKQWPVYVEMKINGWRCKSLLSQNNVLLYTRGGKKYHWLCKLREQLKVFMTYLPGDSELDGELWNSKYSRQKIQSILSNVSEEHSLNSTMVYHIFDMVESEFLPFNKRYELLFRAFEEFVKDGNDSSQICIVNKFLANTHEEVVKFHDIFVNEYEAEGAVIKKICSEETWKRYISNEQLTNKEQKELKESRYQSRRCNSMYKLKDFSDEEGTIINGEIAKGTQEGCVVFQVESPTGKIFNIGSMKGIELEERRRMANNISNLIGKKITYRYQELSDEGIPQHPVCMGLRLLD